MISKFFINHPTIAIVISILMVIVGAVAMVSLPVAQYPEIVPPKSTSRPFSQARMQKLWSNL